MADFYNVFLNTENAQQVFSKLDHCRKMVKRGSEPRCLLVTGPSGVGKSFIFKEYVKQNPKTKKVGGYDIPVLLTRIAEKPTIADTAFKMLEDLEQGFIASLKDARTLVTMLKGLLVRCNTKIIIIDEFQELVEFKTIEEIINIANWLKHLSCDANIPIVLTGTMWSQSILEEAQWSSRMMYRIELEYFCYEERSMTEFRRILIGLARRLPIKTALDFNEDKIAIPILLITEGSFRHLKWFLEDAVEFAEDEDAESLTKYHLISALLNNIKCEPSLIGGGEGNTKTVFDYSENKLIILANQAKVITSNDTSLDSANKFKGKIQYNLINFLRKK
ncbi:MAG: TniB family NTP-binding protein [Colwellia sp.]